MGLLDDVFGNELDNMLNQYPAYLMELNESNVQSIFNRCLAKDGTPKENVSGSILFSRTLGYKPEEEIVFYFDKEKLLANKKSIKYLYGQLRSVHQKKDELCLDDAWYDYSGKRWSTDKACLLYLLYLGCTHETLLISPFNAEISAAVLDIDTVKPTLSPKDPNLPAWWETHKAEWENPS